jgi:hypothetical protein
MPVFLKRPILNSLPFVEETDLPLKPLFKKGGQYIRWEKLYIYVSNVAEISHLLLPCHEPLLSSDVSVWSDLVCLCMSCGSGICTWASQSVCLCVCLWHVCHVSEYVQSQSCYIRRQLDHPSFRGKAVKFSGSFNFRYILYWFICAVFLSTLIDAVVFLIHFSHCNVFPCISKHFRRDRFHYFMLYCCDR